MFNPLSREPFVRTMDADLGRRLNLLVGLMVVVFLAVRRLPRHVGPPVPWLGAVVVALLVVTPLLVLGLGLILGYRIDERGVTRVRLAWPARHWPWAAIRDVVREDKRLRLTTDAGDVVLEASPIPLASLARQLDERLHGPRPPAAEMPAAQVEGYLGVAPGEALLVIGGSTWASGGVVFVVLATLAAAAFTWRVTHHPVAVAAVSVLALGLLIRHERSTLKALTADGHGLRVVMGGREEVIPWAAVRALRSVVPTASAGLPLAAGMVTIETEAGDLTVHPRLGAAQRCLVAIEQILAARAGHEPALPE